MPSDAGDAGDGFDPFAAGGIERVVPTNASQREVWLSDQLGRAASLAFNESVLLDLVGPLDPAAWCAALDDVVARHPALRSTIGPDGAEVVVGEAARGHWPCLDLRSQAPERRAEALERAARDAVETPFDLARGPLFRAELHRIDDTRHRAVLTAHHIVCDGWSWRVVVDDLGTFYAQRTGAGTGPAAPADDMAAHVAWERAETEGAAGAAHRRFWLDRFPGDAPLPVLDLPADHARPPTRSFRSRRVDHELPAALVAQAARVGAQHGASAFTTLFAAFAATLHRLTGQSDLVIGVPAAGQAASGLERLVCHCVNLLPIRTDPQPEEPFADYLRRAAGTVLDAFEHQALTWASLLAMLAVPRDPSRLPLVDVMFNLDAGDGVVAGFPGLDATLATNPRRFENLECFVNAVRLPGGGLRLECQYAVDLFDDATVARWLRGFETVLRAAVDDPRQPIGRLPAIAAIDAAALVAWQGTASGEAPAGLMHGAFERQARAEPQRFALRAGGAAGGGDDRRLRYGELDARANRLARALRARGIGRGDRVGLALSRGAEMVTALLAVLKAGAAYVPLDPGFPPARLAFQAQDAAIALLLGDSAVAAVPGGWCADAEARTVRVDADAAWLAESDAPLPPGPRDAAPADPAYVIYTSGSTGRPKGVSVPHGAVANFLAGMQKAPGLGADDRLAAVTTLSFDIAVLELLLPLSVGAEVVVVARDTAMDGALLAACLYATGATAMQATPGQWRLLVDAGWRGSPGFKALSGGEGLPADLAVDLLDRVGALWNLYGPTETTVWSTRWRVDRAALARSGVSIGAPIEQTVARVVDGFGQPCPIGVAGELWIGGHGVAHGYVDRPELTAERFVVAEAEPYAGMRFYRTGDRARWRNDGLLEHLGRLDFQVKVRGYRIEPGEVEAACDAIPGVARSVVVAVEAAPGDVRLVAYVCAAAGAGIDAAALRAALRERLPEYMVPSHVVVLEALPMLPNGKIDRRALPSPTPEAPPPSGRVAPRDPTERAVLAAMEAVLKLPELGVHDDFFALGGHSLLAARLTTRLGSALGIAVPLRAVFEAPTAAGLAARLAAARVDGHAPARPRGPGPAGPVQGAGSRRVGPLTPAQQRIRFVEELHPGSTAYNTPSAHRLHGPMDTAAFVRAFAALLAHQPALRTHVARRADGGHEQRVVDAFDHTLPLVDLSAYPADEREARLETALADAVARPIDIHALPLFHAALFRLDPRHHVFLFVPHHIVWDGWSFDVLHEDLAAFYAAELARADGGPAAPLPALAATPLDHAHAYERWLQGDEARDQLAWWKRRYATVRPPLALPRARPRTAGMLGRGDWRPVAIDLARTERLREAARRADLTLGMLGMLVFAALLGSAAASSGVVLGLPVRGRQSGDLDRTMGFFNNLLPISVAVDPATTLADAARALKRDVVDAMANQEIAFELLSVEPEVQAAASASGLYQASYSFQDFRERQTRWGPLVHSRLPLFQRGVTEELGLWLAEHESGLSGALTYDADVFDAASAQALHDRCLALFDRIAVADLATDTIGTLTRFAAPVFEARPQPPAPPPAPTVARSASPLPQSPREKALAAIWAGLLVVDVDDLRSTDNFFDLGGDSLLAMRAVEAGVASFGVRVDARRYIYESLAQIAAASHAAAAAPEPATDRGVGAGGWGRRIRALVQRGARE